MGTIAALKQGTKQLRPERDKNLKPSRGKGQILTSVQVRKNEPERLLDELATANGWTVTKRGWPDFLCFSDETGEMIAVEVKPRLPSGRLQLLKVTQAKCLDYLTAHGIRCFVSDGLTLEKYSREKHASDKQRRKSRMESAIMRGTYKPRIVA